MQARKHNHSGVLAQVQAQLPPEDLLSQDQDLGLVDIFHSLHI